MSYLRFIAWLMLPVFLLGSPSLGSEAVSASGPNPHARIEGKKISHLVTWARVEQVKSVTYSDCHTGKTPINWLPFAAPVVETTWQISAVVSSAHIPLLAPSLTGIVVLQI